MQELKNRVRRARESHNEIQGMLTYGTELTISETLNRGYLLRQLGERDRLIEDLWKELKLRGENAND